MANVRDPFSADALKDPKVLQNLRLSRDIAVHFTDTEFTATVEKLHGAAKRLPADQEHIDWTCQTKQVANSAYADPCLMQALMTLYGKNPKPGDPDPRREPLQEKHLTAVEDLGDAEEAKVKGNEFFKAGDLPMALAHYQRAMTIVRMKVPYDVLTLVTLLSNSSLCLIKVDFPDRAKMSCTQALRAVEKLADPKFDQSKLFYRRALACENMDELANAEDDMKRAMKEAERIGLGPPEQQRLRKEHVRVQRLHKSQIDEHRKKDMERGYWGGFVKKDVVAEYEDANKWSSGEIEDRFQEDGTEARFDKWGDRIVAADATPEHSSDKKPNEPVEGA